VSKKFTLFGGFSAFAVFGRVNLPEGPRPIVRACGGATGLRIDLFYIPMFRQDAKIIYKL
jgi:hypothetical protein